jgi:hypothetical protein
MEYSMVLNWSAGCYDVKSDGPTLYQGIIYHGTFHGIFHPVNAPYDAVPQTCYMTLANDGQSHTKGAYIFMPEIIIRPL